MIKIRKEIIQHIEREIFPLYERNEKGHGINHIKEVINRSFDLIKDLDVNKEMVYVIASYHDLGHFIDAKTHEIISAKMLEEDKKLENWFSKEQIQIMKEAVEDHRASCTHIPRSIYGKIISSADRTLLNIDDCIKRCYSYGKKHTPEKTEEEQIERVHEHLSEKYGKDGYAKCYIKDEAFDKSLENLQKALENKEEFIRRVKEVIKREEF